MMNVLPIHNKVSFGNSNPINFQEKSEEIKRVNWVKNYYPLVDQDQYDAFLKGMADDVSYSREGWPVLNGKEAVQDFFEHQRQLHGQHIVTDIHTTPAVLVNGRFVGTNAGQPISLNFQDLWTFQPDQRVAFRKSWISIPGV